MLYLIHHQGLSFLPPKSIYFSPSSLPAALVQTIIPSCQDGSLVFSASSLATELQGDCLKAPLPPLLLPVPKPLLEHAASQQNKRSKWDDQIWWLSFINLTPSVVRFVMHVQGVCVLDTT